MEEKLLEQDRNYEEWQVVFNEQEVKRLEDKVTRYLNTRLSLPGFRPGRIPKNILKARLGQEFEDYIADFAYSEWMEKHDGSNVLDHELSHEFRDGVLVLNLKVHWIPEVELPKPEDLTVEIPPSEEVVEEFIKNALEDLRGEKAILEPKEGPAEYGDVVEIEMRPKMEDEESSETRTYQILLKDGDERRIVTELVGKKRDDVFDMVSEMDESITFEIKILQVYRRTLPELDDSFAKMVDEGFETLADLEESLRKAGFENFEIFKKEYVPKIALIEFIKNAKLDVSEKTIDRLLEKNLEKADRKDLNEDEEFLRNAREEIVKYLKVPLAINKYASENGIEINEEIFEEYVERLAANYSTTSERLKKLLAKSPDLVDDLLSELLRELVAQDLAKKVTIVEKAADQKAEDGGGEGESNES